MSTVVTPELPAISWTQRSAVARSIISVLRKNVGFWFQGLVIESNCRVQLVLFSGTIRHLAPLHKQSWGGL